MTTAREPFRFTYNEKTPHLAGLGDRMLFELVKQHWVALLVIVFFVNVLIGIHEAATRKPTDSGWEDIPLQKPTERWLRSIDGRGRTSVQIRKEGVGVKKKVR
ncbi:protein of unknown function [Pararobbsia alpina]